jgi:hypothetical protein
MDISSLTEEELRELAVKLQPHLQSMARPVIERNYSARINFSGPALSDSQGINRLAKELWPTRSGS